MIISVILCFILGSTAIIAQQQPNIIFILADDLVSSNFAHFPRQYKYEAIFQARDLIRDKKTNRKPTAGSWEVQRTNDCFNLPISNTQTSPRKLIK